jgi:hypothetical protein
MCLITDVQMLWCMSLFLASISKTNAGSFTNGRQRGKEAKH